MVLSRNIREVPTSLTNSTASLNSIETNMTLQHHNQQTQNANERTVYLGDLDMDVNEKQLQEFFYVHNIPVSKIAKQPHSSYAHVTFVNSDTARKFLEASNINLNGRSVRIMPFNQPNNFDPNANLIIKNLEGYLNETDIINKMKRFGDILSCKLVRDENGQSKCYSYLQFKDPKSAAEAIDKLNNTYWDEKCDPDYKYKMFQQKLSTLKHSQLLGKLNESDLQESQLFADFNNKMGKKIYVGLFKKKDEYTKIKSDKEGKPSNLYVKNFGTNFGDRDLFNLFKTFGSIKSAKVRRMKTGLVEKPLGCGFVDFENPEEAERARLALDNYELPDCGRIISVTYADCKSRRMRKKLEENEIKQQNKQQQQPQDIDLLVEEELVKPMATPSPPKTPVSPTYSNFFNNEIINIDISSMNRLRKTSNSSDTSFDTTSQISTTSMTSMTTSPSPLFSDDATWNKLLGHTHWNAYKLFDNQTNLFN